MAESGWRVVFNQSEGLWDEHESSGRGGSGYEDGSDLSWGRGQWRVVGSMHWKPRMGGQGTVGTGGSWE